MAISQNTLFDYQLISMTNIFFLSLLEWRKLTLLSLNECFIERHGLWLQHLVSG
jgi:hypothetical protein